ncbi:sensor domain-containing diguanylate cyclase, partial [candidate division NPL-UPA2 bacterium]|nr:sensor domain-containing diguanylate cyclase [candidate division NPL-UPA2 bacterium]
SQGKGKKSSMYVNSFLLVLLYASPLLATILAFCKFAKFLQGRRQETLAASESLRKRNEQILRENEKLQEGNKNLGKKVGQIQDLYEITREIGTSLEFESTFQIFSKKLKEVFSFGRAELILLEEKNGKIAIKRTLEIGGRETPAGRRGRGEEDPSLEKNLVNLFGGEQRRAVFIADTSQSLRARRLSLPREVKSFSAIPLIVKKELLAIITMENMREDDFDRLSVVAAQLALAIKKARLYQEAQELSIIDGLTGAFLRRHFRERLEEELQRSRQHRLPLSFLMADIDHFKEYNDKYGHLVGDAVLKDIAHLLEEGVREIDLVGRYGGEEFSLLLAETSKESALQVAERLRLSVEEHQFKAYDEVGKATISIGLATFPEDAQEAESLIDKADRALYKAKQSGRNRVCTLT